MQCGASSHSSNTGFVLSQPFPKGAALIAQKAHSLHRAAPFGNSTALYSTVSFGSRLCATEHTVPYCCCSTRHEARCSGFAAGKRRTLGANELFERTGCAASRARYARSFDCHLATHHAEAIQCAGQNPAHTKMVMPFALTWTSALCFRRFATTMCAAIFRFTIATRIPLP